MYGYIYLLREREFLNKCEHVYKVGRTEQEEPSQYLQRLRSYKKGSQLVSISPCNTSYLKKVEDKIIKIFNKKFIKHNDGREYFIGNPDKMYKIINKCISCYNSKNEKKEEIENIAEKDGNICEHLIAVKHKRNTKCDKCREHHESIVGDDYDNHFKIFYENNQITDIIIAELYYKINKNKILCISQEDNNKILYIYDNGCYIKDGSVKNGKMETNKMIDELMIKLLNINNKCYEKIKEDMLERALNTSGYDSHRAYQNVTAYGKMNDIFVKKISNTITQKRILRKVISIMESSNDI